MDPNGEEECKPGFLFDRNLPLMDSLHHHLTEKCSEQFTCTACNGLVPLKDAFKHEEWHKDLMGKINSTIDWLQQGSDNLIASTFHRAAFLKFYKNHVNPVPSILATSNTRGEVALAAARHLSSQTSDATTDLRRYGLISRSIARHL